MDVYTGDKYFVQSLFIASPQLKREKALGRGCHAIIDKTKDVHQPPNHVEDTIVLNTECLKNHSRCVQVNTHHKCHTEIQQSRIPHDT